MSAHYVATNSNAYSLSNIRFVSELEDVKHARVDVVADPKATKGFLKAGIAAYRLQQNNAGKTPLANESVRESRVLEIEFKGRIREVRVQRGVLWICMAAAFEPGYRWQPPVNRPPAPTPLVHVHAACCFRGLV